MFANRSGVRRPVVAGAFYPSGAQELESTIEAMLLQTMERKLGGLCGVVTPCLHDLAIRTLAGLSPRLIRVAWLRQIKPQRLQQLRLEMRQNQARQGPRQQRKLSNLPIEGWKLFSRL